MPELAEVEYFRRQWNPGIGKRIARVSCHSEKRIFRGVDLDLLESVLAGSKFLESTAHGKRMLFRFSRKGWLGIHLGMTGTLRTEAPHFEADRHDHLVLYQAARSLVFNDPRQFGRVQFHQGDAEPEWWRSRPPSVDSSALTTARLRAFLQRHRMLPLKSALLLQNGFPGIGNWMADEILWRARFDPHRRAGELNDQELAALRQAIRRVARGALKYISPDFADPPKGWLFNERWKKTGICPIHGTALSRDRVGGRTTVWCPRCRR